MKHLQHENFLYEMDVENTGPPKVAIVRQYLIPAYHLYGYSKSLNYKFNRVIEMDKFTVKRKCLAFHLIKNFNSHVITWELAAEIAFHKNKFPVFSC